MEESLSKIIEQVISDSGLPGTAAVIIDSSGNRLFYKAFGVNDTSSSNPVPYTTSTPTMIWSCTKLVTSIAALKLLEGGSLSLEVPASKYLPELTEMSVLDSTLDTEGKLGTRPAKSQILIRHLLTHTSGLCHDYFDPRILRWRVENGMPIASNFGATSRLAFKTPLLNDPGMEFHYGPSSEWLGFLIETVTGMQLHDYITKTVLQPLGMTSTTAVFDTDIPRLIVHTRGASGKEDLKSLATIQPAPDAVIRTGGSYLISTLDDFTTLLLTLLNSGTHLPSKAQILRPESVARYLFTDHVGVDCDRSTVGEVKSVLPHISHNGSLLPGVPRGWSCGMMPGGRKAGSGMWAGIGNLYYWIDPVGSRAGMVMTSVMPWLEPCLLKIFQAIEKAAYAQTERTLQQ